MGCAPSTALKRYLHSSTLVWREMGKGQVVSSFTLRLHGWRDTRCLVVVREPERGALPPGSVFGYTFRVWCPIAPKTPPRFGATTSGGSHRTTHRGIEERHAR